MSYEANQEPTRWSLILRAKADGPDGRKALAELVRRYERTINATLRRFPCPPDRSYEDLGAQFLESFVKPGAIDRLDPGVGRFRGWLRTVLRRHVARAWRAWRAQQHGNELTTDTESFETLSSAASASAAEDRCLVAEILDVFDAALAVHRERSKDKMRFELLAPYVSGRVPEAQQRTVLAEKLGITPNALSAAIHSLKDRHTEIVKEVVADGLNVDPRTAVGQQQVLQELRTMLETLARCRDHDETP